MSSVSAQGQDSDYQCLSSVDSVHSHHSDMSYYQYLEDSADCSLKIDDHNSNVTKTSKESLAMIYRKRLNLVSYGYARNSSHQNGMCTDDIMKIIMLFHSDTILYLKCSYIDFEILQCYLSDKANKILNINSYKATYKYDTIIKNVTDCHLSVDDYFIGLLKLDFHHKCAGYTFQIEINVLDTHENVIFNCCFNFNFPMIFYRFNDYSYHNYMWDFKQLLQISSYKLYASAMFEKIDLMNASVMWYQNRKGFSLLLSLSDTFLWTVCHFLLPKDIDTFKICCKQLLMVCNLRQIGLNANKITLDINQWICLMDRMNLFGDIILWHRVFDYILKCDDINVNYGRIYINDNGHRTFSERTLSTNYNIKNKITIMDVKSFIAGPFCYVNAQNVEFHQFIQDLRDKILNSDPSVYNKPVQTCIINNKYY